MVHGDDRYDRHDRFEDVVQERAVQSVNRYVDDLLEVEQSVNDAYHDPVEIDGEEYLPFLFTKGMPLERDENGDRLPEGLVPRWRHVENYIEPIRERSNLSDPETFERGGDRLFIGYPAVYTVGLAGMEAWEGRMPPAPDPTGEVNAAEMIDVYGMEQLRDVPFVQWPNEPGGDGSVGIPDDVLEALSTDLERIRDEEGRWWHDADRLFVEANTDSVDWGPYVSQFLLRDVQLWALNAAQEYLRYPPGVDHNDTKEAWLDNLEGKGEYSAEVNPNKPPRENQGYVTTPRHLATIVNAEPPYQEYLIATIQLLGDVEFDKRLPYRKRDQGKVFDYTETGPPGLLDMVARAGRQALLAAFYQKYYQHFRCRPETYAGRLHAQRHGGREAFGIDDLVADAALLSSRADDTAYLSTAYVEGSPVHPAYPSGHSVIAGACGTVLKTWFRDVEWPDDGYYVPTVDVGPTDEIGTAIRDVPLPSGHEGVYQEIDKLMSNVGLARMFAGVHYYSDHYWGVKLGEQVAVGLMADVFERHFTGGEESNPTFRPYLDYDEEYEISVEVLDDLREAAATADSPIPRLP
jgi:hypothetical protein